MITRIPCDESTRVESIIHIGEEVADLAKAMADSGRQIDEKFNVPPHLIPFFLETAIASSPVSISEVARRVSVSRSSGTLMAQALETMGLVVRDRSIHTDRRVVALSLTPRGRAAYQRYVQAQLADPLFTDQTDYQLGRFLELIHLICPDLNGRVPGAGSQWLSRT